MSSHLPCQGCRGLCCGPVPVTEIELKTIRKKVKAMPVKVRSELENQQRHFGTCLFYDMEKDRCGIHAVRPSVCRAFGHYSNLVCFRKPEAAAAEQWRATGAHVGILTVDFTWQDFK